MNNSMKPREPLYLFKISLVHVAGQTNPDTGRKRLSPDPKLKDRFKSSKRAQREEDNGSKFGGIVHESHRRLFHRMWEHKVLKLKESLGWERCFSTNTARRSK